MNFFNKFKSRKFLVTLAAVIIGLLAMVFGEETVVNMFGGFISIISSATYTIVEGAIDTARFQNDTAKRLEKEIKK